MPCGWRIDIIVPHMATHRIALPPAFPTTCQTIQAPPSQSKPTLAERPTRLQAILWAVSTIIMALLALRNWTAIPIGANEDASYYIVLAESLLKGPVYGLLYNPRLPLPTNFPFGFPLLLAPLIHIFPGDFDILRGIAFVATLLNGVLLFWGWRRLAPGFSYWIGLGTSALQVVVLPYLAVLLVWSWAGPRLLYPLQPQLLLCLLLGISATIRQSTIALRRQHLARRLSGGAVGLGVCVLIVGFLWTDGRLVSSLHVSPNTAQRTSWIRANAPPDAIILSTHPSVDFIYSRRYFLSLPPD